MTNAKVDPFAGSVLSSRKLPMDVVGRPSWTQSLGRILHVWRYGFRHPDEDLLGVIEAVGDALGVQIATAKSVLSGARLEEAVRIETELKDELTKPLPDFSALLAIEARIQAIYPPQLERRRRWVIQERFQRVAAPTARQSWMMDPPPAEEYSADPVALEQAEEGLRQARLHEDQAVAAKAAADGQLDIARAALEAEKAKLSADPTFDLSEARRQVSEAPDDTTLDGLRQQLAPLLAAEQELGRAETAAADAETARAAAAAATGQSKDRCRLAEADFAARRAKADFMSKSALADAARRAVAALPANSPERAPAEQALEKAESARAVAQKVADDKTAIAARIRSETDGHGGGGGSGGEEGGGAASPAGGTGGEALSDQQADQLTLLNYIQTHYLLTISREKAIRDLKRWLIMRFWLSVILLALFLLVTSAVLVMLELGRFWPLALGLVVVAGVGRAGATMSVAQRLQKAVDSDVLDSDPVIELTALRTGKNEITLALLSSSIFALLLYAFFLSGVPHMLGFQDGIFPRSQWTILQSPQGQGGNSPTQTVQVPVASAPAAQAPADGNVAAVDLNAATPAAAVDGNGLAPAQAEEPATSAPIPQPIAAAQAPDGNAAAPAPPAPAARHTSRGEVPQSAAAFSTQLVCNDGEDCMPFDNWASALGLVSAADFFKLLIWAFLAGFAERLVPDVLDRIVSRAQVSRSQTVIASRTLVSPAGAAPPIPLQGGGGPVLPPG